MSREQQNTGREHKVPDPQRAYDEELHSRGSELKDSPEEGEARDLAKIHKSIDGQGQKMDSVHPDDLKPDRNDQLMEEARDEA